MSITFFFIFSPPGNAPRWLYVPTGIFHLCLAFVFLSPFHNLVQRYGNCILQVTLARTPSQFLTYLHKTVFFHFTPSNFSNFLRSTSHLPVSFLSHCLLHGPLCFSLPSLPTRLYLRPVKMRRGKSLLFLCDKITQSCGHSQSY